MKKFCLLSLSLLLSLMLHAQITITSSPTVTVGAGVNSTGTLTITATVPWSIVTTNAPVTASPSSGNLGTYTITFTTTAANEISTNSYSPFIMNSSNGAQTSFKIIQLAACTNAFVLPTTATICSGGSTTLTATGFSSYSAIGSYVWSTGATLTTTATIPSPSSITVSPTITTVYSVTGTTTGCTNTASVTVTVNPLPTITATASPTIISSGAISTLTVSGASSYVWSNGVTTASQTVIPNGSTNYSVTGTAANLCTNVATVPVSVVAALNDSYFSFPLDGTAVDVSGNGLTGTIVGTVTATTDRFGNTSGAMLFDGSTGYIDIPLSTGVGTNDYSISYWANQTTLTQGLAFSKDKAGDANSQFRLGYESDGNYIESSGGNLAYLPTT
jgi:hypothetical protein